MGGQAVNHRGAEGSKARLWLEGAGAGILLALGLIWNDLSIYRLDIYQRQMPINTVVRAVTIDLVLICIACVVLLWLLERFDERARTLCWAIFASALIARALDGLKAVEILDYDWLTTWRAFAVIFALWLLVWIAARRWYSPAVKGFRFFLLLLGFCIFWILPQLVVLGLAHQPHDQASFAKPLPSQPTPHRRIIWVLFDEMSYDQSFDHRWPGLQMPNFDQLRAESVNFSDVQPDGYFTRVVVPSLLLGQPVNAVRSSSAGYLSLRSSPHASWRRFNPGATLFADAKRMGWTTGIMSWAFPDCRIMPQQLDSCWMQLVPYNTDHLSQERSTWENVTVPVRAIFARLEHHPLHDGMTATQWLNPMLDAGERLAANDGVDFVFIHLPLPHPVGIYHRKTGKIGYGGSYIDNLALSDKVLGELEATIAKTPSASMTTLVVSSDHSWRVPMWRGKSGWTREDEAASRDGYFDPRPVLLVHFPGETTGATMSKPFPILKEHDFFETLLHEPLSEAQFEAWAQQQTQK